MQWRCRHRTIDLARPVVMGILNVTPDSFSDGGRYQGVEAALARAAQMVAEGAAIIDVGGESTRPGSLGVDAATERERVVPVIEGIAASLDVAISIDTSKVEVMQAAAQAGACIVNDVAALRAPGAREWAADAGVGVCLMHMQGEPRSMQADPRYHDVVSEVNAFLRHERAQCIAAGIAAESIAVLASASATSTPSLYSSTSTTSRARAPRCWWASRARVSSARCSDATSRRDSTAGSGSRPGP